MYVFISMWYIAGCGSVFSRSARPFFKSVIIFFSAAVPFVWKAPDLAGWIGLVFIGLLGSFAHLLLILAYARAPASTLAPLSYLQLIWSTTLGLILFGNFPDGWTWLGVAIIVACGVYVGYRERKRRGEPALPKAKGYLSIYQRSVQPMSTGAVLVKQD